MASPSLKDAREYDSLGRARAFDPESAWHPALSLAFYFTVCKWDQYSQLSPCRGSCNGTTEGDLA